VPDEAELAAFGFCASDYEHTAVPIWPDNETAVNVFVAMSTQWRTGFNGATGLDYGALPVVLRLQQIPRPDWPDTFDALRVLEGEALAVMREASERK
jgi:hypothetical protein